MKLESLMNSYHFQTKNKFSEYFLTAFFCIIVVVSICFVIELELLFRTEKQVNTEQLSMANLSRFCTIEELEKRQANEPNNYFVTIRLAQMYEDLNDNKKANELYQLAIKKSGKSNYCLYNYALFCARHQLYALSATLGEEMTGNNRAIGRYKAGIYETIGDNLDKEQHYLGALKSYQIAYKYYKTLDKASDFKRITDKYANAYIDIADKMIAEKNIVESISNLENSLKLKKTAQAKYKLGIAYRGSNKIKAERYINEAYKENPYLVNPYIYENLLNELIFESKSQNDISAINFYTLKLNNFKNKLSKLYIYKDDIEIISSKIVCKKTLLTKKKNCLLVLNIKNKTKERIPKLLIKTELWYDNKHYEVFSRAGSETKPVDSYQIISAKAVLPSEFKILKGSMNNKAIAKYFVRKRENAPWTLLKFELINI